MANGMQGADPGRGALLADLVFRLDACLRHLHGIEEFTDDPACLLRIAKKKATRPVSLSNGIEVRQGDVIGELHLWNGQLPGFVSGGPTLGWAKRVHRMMLHSLSCLADYVQCEPTWRQVQAFYADVPTSPKRSMASVHRSASRYGFEATPQRRTAWRFAHEIGESLLLRLLAHAFNPAALHRQAFLRRRQRIWITRLTLVRRYRSAGRRDAQPQQLMSAPSGTDA